MGMIKLIKTMVICAGLYLAIAPATLVLNNSVNNILSNNGRNNVYRVL